MMQLQRRDVWRSPEATARLTYYPPGAEMHAHIHENDQYSVLVLGGFREVTTSGEADLHGFSAGFKAAGQRHENLYGRDGAIILAIDAPPRETDRGWHWRQPTARENILPLVKMLLERRKPANDSGDVVHELISLIEVTPDDSGGHLRNGRTPPNWLRRVREEIDDAPMAADLTSLAGRASVHVTHLSRSFAQSFGVPLSVYRRRVMAMRAAQAMMHEVQTPAAAANTAGFADQSHLTRVLRRETGLTPRRFQALFDAPEPRAASAC